MNRTCGDCVACCAYLKISALDKPGCKNCKHLTLDRQPDDNEMILTGSSTKGNCSIYKDRPEVCKGYKCLWILGHGEEKDRPDKSFILADTIHQIENAIECRQLKPNIIDTTGIETIKRLSKSTGKVAMVPIFGEGAWDRIVGRPE